ncbi:Clusterin associated protein 1 [Echinococcus multilocularis]|uniref:Clusterin associated protein 1 n=2 Tax=Echinococcus multilocularis TaxID=6211 RepID=A0A068Y292_ECHMU|nr:Clusterin associated protein 1 [Echinococcus multilocularis]
MMRTLGYARLISLESFRAPNFSLMAEILRWLALRFDPNADIPKFLDTEQDRVIFIKVIVQFMVVKAFIKLNAKRLYKADGCAVKEMLKIVKLLHSSLKFGERTGDDEQLNLNFAEILSIERLKQLQHTRFLASQLTSSGASLYSHMSHEVDFRQIRNDAIHRQFDIEFVEKCLSGACDAVRAEIAKAESALNNIRTDENNLNGKIEKKRGELERNQKRLLTLQSVRPAYMEEYEQLEEELNVYYETYLTQFRNLSYLENLKEEIMRSEDTKIPEDEAAIKSAVEELRRITDAAGSLLHITDGGVSESMFSSKCKSAQSKRNSAVEFSNANAEPGLGLSEDSEGIGSDKSTSDGDEEEEGDDQEESSTSSDSVTSDSETESVIGGDYEHGTNDNDDVIKGLSIVGTGYRMCGTWSPGRALAGAHGETAGGGISADPLRTAVFNNSSALKANREVDSRREGVDRALAEVLAEASALTEGIELAKTAAEEGKGGTYRNHTATSRITRIPEVEEEGEEEEEEVGGNEDDPDDF